MSPKVWRYLNGLKWFLFWFLTSKIAWLWMAYNDREVPVALFHDNQLKISYDRFNKFDDTSGCRPQALNVEIMNENVTFVKTPVACKDNERIVMVLSHPNGIYERQNIRQQLWEFNNKTQLNISEFLLFLVF